MWEKAEAKDDPFIPRPFTAGEGSYGNHHPECPEVPIANTASRLPPSTSVSSQRGPDRYPSQPAVSREAQRSLGDPGPDWPEQGRKMCTKLQGFVAILSTRQKSMVWPVPGDAQEERGWERGCSTRANSKSKVERQKLLSEHRGQFKILN